MYEQGKKTQEETLSPHIPVLQNLPTGLKPLASQVQR